MVTLFLAEQVLDVGEAGFDRKKRVDAAHAEQHADDFVEEIAIRDTVRDEVGITHVLIDVEAAHVSPVGGRGVEQGVGAFAGILLGAHQGTQAKGLVHEGFELALHGFLRRPLEQDLAHLRLFGQIGPQAKEATAYPAPLVHFDRVGSAVQLEIKLHLVDPAVDVLFELAAAGQAEVHQLQDRRLAFVVAGAQYVDAGEEAEIPRLFPLETQAAQSELGAWPGRSGQGFVETLQRFAEFFRRHPLELGPQGGIKVVDFGHPGPRGCGRRAGATVSRA